MWRVSSRQAGALVAAVAVAVVFVLADLGSKAHAQTFNDAIQRALDKGCSGLSGPLGAYQGTLRSICSVRGGASGGAGTSAGASIASQTMRQQGPDERRIQLRLEEQREAGGSPAASADQSLQLRELGLFITGEGEWVRKDVTRFEPAFSSDAGGVILGADYRVRPWLTAGLALSYLHTHGDFTGNNGDFNTNAFGVTLFGSITPLPNLFVDSTVGYTRRHYDTVRRAIYSNADNGTAINGLVQGDTRGNEFRASVQAGYDLVIRAFTLGPRVGVNYSTNAIDSYSERNWSPRNLDTGLQLAYDAQHRHSLTSSVGVFASYALSTSIGVFVPQLTGEWVHEFQDNQRVIYFRFRQDIAQTQLGFQTDPPDRNYGNVGTGVVLVLANGVEAFVSFRALVGYRDREAYTTNGGLRIRF